MKTIETGSVALIKSAPANTRDGRALTLNRAPSDDLSPWIARVYATHGVPDMRDWLRCGILADTHYLRVLMEGHWGADTRDGEATFERRVLFFGQNSKEMPVRLRGTFRSTGLAFKAGAATVLGAPEARDTLDCILGYDRLGGSEAALLERCDRGSDPHDWMAALEDCFRLLLEEQEVALPDPIATAFERQSFVNPTQPISRFARAHDISTRQLERIVRRDFGLTPKQVMRRARVLDLAANLRGVAEQDEAEELALRYFDQSHVNRDFLEFFGMTPVRFLRTEMPLMTMALEQRQARRLEVIGRLADGERRPWE